MKNRTHRRWRLFACPAFQGGMATRLVIYWFLFQAAAVWTDAVFRFLSEGHVNYSGWFSPPMTASALVLPVAIFEMIVFTNRFSGPLINLTRRMDELAAGIHGEPLQFRPRDHYKQLEKSFNQLREQLIEFENNSIEPDCIQPVSRECELAESAG